MSVMPLTPPAGVHFPNPLKPNDLARRTADSVARDSQELPYFRIRLAVWMAAYGLPDSAGIVQAFSPRAAANGPARSGSQANRYSRPASGDISHASAGALSRPM